MYLLQSLAYISCNLTTKICSSDFQSIKLNYGGLGGQLLTQLRSPGYGEKITEQRLSNGLRNGVRNFAVYVTDLRELVGSKKL